MFTEDVPTFAKSWAQTDKAFQNTKGRARAAPEDFSWQCCPGVATESPITAEPHMSKALRPMLVTESGMVIEVSELQSPKA